MSDKKYNILVLGLLSTGSSALIDLLREYENCSVIPDEFDDFRAPGLVADQLVYDQSNGFPNKIKSLCTPKKKLKLIYNIFPAISLSSRVLSEIHDRYIINISRLKSLNHLNQLNEHLEKVHSLEEKLVLTNNWITSIAKVYSKGRDFVVFNQAISPTIKTQIWTKVFDPFKLICVYRDPRDQLAEIIKKGYLYAPYGAPRMNHGGLALESIYGRSRDGALKFHIQAIKKRMEWIDKLKIELNPNDFLLIDFEGLTNNYDAYKTKIENFISGLKRSSTKGKLFFNPLYAKKNIGIYEEFLKKSDLKAFTELEDWYKRTVKREN